MIIVADSNQFSSTHKKSNELKHNMLEAAGHEIVIAKVPFGDYTKMTPEIQETINRRGDKLKKMDLVADVKISVDTKKDLGEVIGNICSDGHSRFRDEVILAQKMKARMVVLVEESGIHSVQDIFEWTNPALKRWLYFKKQHELGYKLNIQISKKPPVNGPQLAKSMITMANKYGIEWQFCSRTESAKRIVEILSED